MQVKWSLGRRIRTEIEIPKRHIHSLKPRINGGILSGLGVSRGVASMSLQFHRAVENMDIWSASCADISFVITFASPTGSGFHGRRGFLASRRPLYSSTGAVKVIGSPFNSFADAEGACNAMLGTLERAGRGGSAQVNNAAPLSVNFT
jgi:hypothetical protein